MDLAERVSIPRRHGIGLRVSHYAEIVERGVPGVDFVEAISENFIRRGGRPRAVLDRVRRDVSVALHGVSMSIGGCDPLNELYLSQLRDLCDEIEPLIVSDHLCFGTLGGNYGHDLWPVPFTSEMLAHLAARVDHVQGRLNRRLLLENVSSYVTYRASEMTEWELLARLTQRTGCGVLLDVNNVFVSARNHGIAADAFIGGLPVGSVGQIHVAGHSDKGDYLLDDHSGPVPGPVWHLYEQTVVRFGAIPTIVEWDENVPTLDRLVREAQTARAIETRTLERRAA